MLLFLARHPLEHHASLEHWLVDLHNDVNRRTRKPLLTLAAARLRHRDTDARHALVEFALAAAFCLRPTPEARRCLAMLLRRGASTVGMPPLPPNTPLPEDPAELPRAVYDHLRPFRYPTYGVLVADFLGTGDAAAGTADAGARCDDPASVAGYVAREEWHNARHDLQQRAVCDRERHLRAYLASSVPRHLHRRCPHRYVFDPRRRHHNDLARAIRVRRPVLTTVGIAVLAVLLVLALALTITRIRRRSPRVSTLVY